MTGLIEDYALIGDMQSAALVEPDGSVDWLCLPRFDSDACFAALLGDETQRAVADQPDRPGRPGAPARRAQPHVRGRHADPGDALADDERHGQVTDFMPPRDDEQPVLVRIVEGVAGAVEMETRAAGALRLRPGRCPGCAGSTTACRPSAGPDAVWLRTPVKLAGPDMPTRRRFTVRAGERVPFVLSWMPSHTRPRPEDRRAPRPAGRRPRTFWTDWVAPAAPTRATYRDAVIRSLITLKALTYAPTGGIVAAPTTSLPEDIGGVRNWDYRYCWLRDATITLEALLRTGYTDEAAAWREWLRPRGRRRRPATCRSCTGWRASGGWPSGRPTGCPATRTRPRCGSATPRSTSASSTCTAR